MHYELVLLQSLPERELSPQVHVAVALGHLLAAGKLTWAIDNAERERETLAMFFTPVWELVSNLK